MRKHQPSDTPARAARRKVKPMLTLAMLADDCGVSLAHMSNIERGRYRPHADLAAKMAQFYASRGIALTEEQILYPERFSGSRTPRPDRVTRSRPPVRRAAGRS